MNSFTTDQADYPKLKPVAEAFLAGAEWQINKSRSAGVAELVEAAQEFEAEVDTDQVRVEFEEMASVVYSAALAEGRDPVHGSYRNSNLEKRWTGWKACEEFRAGVKPVPRGKQA